MKKYLLLAAVLLSMILTACGSNSAQQATGQESQEAEEPVDVFANYDITDVQKYIYESHNFGDVFTPEEYVKFCGVLTEMSAEPYYAINKNLVSVKQTIATYNTKEEKYLLIDASGNVIIDYGDNSWVVDGAFNNIRFGDYIFITTNGNPRKYDIINDNGDLINTIKFSDNDIPELIWDFGNGYFIFATVRSVSSNSYDLYILHPDGQYYPATVHPPRYFSANIDLDVENSIYSLDATFGNISEGMYSVCYEYLNNGKNTCAYYCNVNGEIVLNLSSDEMNFYVTELGDFSNGKAEIKFVGMDDKNYVATINTNGEFITEPTLAS